MGQLLIPRIFHRIWLGGQAMSEEFEAYGRSWIKYHPHWEMRLWNEDNMIPLQNQNIYDCLSNLALKSDIARYELLYKYGGVYIDCDFECLKNMEELLNGVEAFAASEAPGIVSIGIIGCVPKNAVLASVIDGLAESFYKNIHSRPSYQTGPMYFTHTVQNKDNFTVFGPELFYPYYYTEKHRRGEHFPNAYAIHYW